MRTKSWVSVGVVGVLALAGAGSAGAQARFERTPDLFPEETFAVYAGGGYTNFTQQATQALTTPGAGWTVRAAWGMPRMWGAEVAYLGAAFPLEMPRMNDTTVVQSGLEALLRLGYPRAIGARGWLTGYLTAGLGWGVFNLLGADEGNAGGVANSDAVITVPLGFGLAVGYDRLSADLRLLYRPAAGDEMFDAASQTLLVPGLNTLSLGATIGYVF